MEENYQFFEWASICILPPLKKTCENEDATRKGYQDIEQVVAVLERVEMEYLG